MASKEGGVKDKFKRIFSKKTSSGGDKAGKGADSYRPMTGSMTGSSFKDKEGGASVPDSKTASAGSPMESSNTPGEVTNGEPSTYSSGPGAEAGSSTAVPEHGVGDVDQAETGDSFANEHWEAAREKTRLAELEAQKAHALTAKANEHLKAAGAAQGEVQNYAEKRQKALADADAIRTSIGNPALLEQDVASAQERTGAKRLAAEEAAKKVQAAQAEHDEAAKVAAEKQPIIDEHHHKISNLTEEYEKHVEEVKARESNKGELLAIADGHRQGLDQHNTDIDALSAELSKADTIAAEREREFITAKDAAAALSTRLAEAKEKRGETEQLFLAKMQEADGADEAIQGYRHETERMQRTLEEEEESWVKMQNMERDYQKDADDAAARLEAIRAEAEPHSHALKEAQEDLNAKQKKLDQAHAQAKEAQAKYDALTHEAEDHAARGNKAAEAARGHAEKHQDLHNQAQMAHSRHRELWEEAKTHGTEGSNIASSVVKKLEEKVHELVHPGADVADATQA